MCVDVIKSKRRERERERERERVNVQLDSVELFESISVKRAAWERVLEQERLVPMKGKLMSFVV